MKKNDRCYLCEGRTLSKVPGSVRDNPALGVLRCDACGLVFLDSFDHLKDDFYSETYTSNHPDEWRLFLERGRADDERRAALLAPLVSQKSFLDVGCGGGGLLLKVKERCARAEGVEPQKKWREKLNGEGLKVWASLEEAKGTYDVIGLFHVLEHIKDPAGFLAQAAKLLAPGGRMLVEVPNSEDALLSLYGCEAFSRFTYWSPHLFLFNARTMKEVILRAGLRAAALKHVQRYPLSNHLHWLSRGKPGGHVEWSFLESPELAAAYERSLAAVGATDTLLAEVRA